MSALFGIRAAEGQPLESQRLQQYAESSAKYGPCLTEVQLLQNVGIGLHAFGTRSCEKSELNLCSDDTLIVGCDGRLDNKPSLLQALNIQRGGSNSATTILCAYKRWGAECFSRFVGEWACVIWDGRLRKMYLARDHAGTRQLYFRRVGDELFFCSHLESLVADMASLEINDAYLLRALTLEPTAETAPYQGVRVVPPGAYIEFSENRINSHMYWRPEALPLLTYRTTSDYDEHFRHLFSEAIARRMESTSGVIAELSGGIDSSAIVCMADRVAAIGDRMPVETVSYFNRSERDWNELPFIEVIERHRGHVGVHIDTSQLDVSYAPVSQRGYPYPVSMAHVRSGNELFNKAMGDRNVRIILSGLGGDELLGGVPTPLPELASHLMHRRFGTLWSRAFAWSVATRTSVLTALRETIVFSLDLYNPTTRSHNDVPPWLQQAALTSHSPGSATTHRPSIGSDVDTLIQQRVWAGILETIPHASPPIGKWYERRYPYLDKDLVEFLHRVPRHELVAPGRRRLLMRRALGDLVPHEVLERRRKAFVSQVHLRALSSHFSSIEQLFRFSQLEARGLLQSSALITGVQAIVSGDTRWLPHVLRAIELELWLQGMAASDERPVDLSKKFENIRPPIGGPSRSVSTASSNDAGLTEIRNKEGQLCVTQNRT